VKNKFSENSTQIINLICAFILLVLIILQFVPYWHYDGMSASINSYVWFPYSHDALKTYLETSLGASVDLNREVITPIIITFVGILILALQIWKPDYSIAMFGTVLIGIAGAYGYLSSDVLQLGSTWILHLVLCIAAVALGILGIVTSSSQHTKA